MSLIEIRKYEYQADRAKNYFASPTFIDGISLDKILIEGFPIFNEEFANEFDSFEYKASDYDLVFSRLESTLTTNGDTLETFLSTALDNHCLVCKVTIGSKIFGGLIDVNSITFIDNLENDGYKIKITIFSIAKEFASFAEGKPTIAGFAGANYFNSLILGDPNVFFRGIDSFTLPYYFGFNNDYLDWETRIGYHPVLIYELYTFIVSNNMPDDTTTWNMFLDLCKAFGLVFKFDFGSITNDYFEITLTTSFRDTGFSGNTVSVDWIDRERGFISDINANVIQCFKFQKEQNVNINGDIIDTHFYGTVFNKDTITTADGDVYSVAGGFGEEGLYSNGDGLTINKLNNPFPFDVVDKVNFVEMNYYFDSSYYNGVGTNVSNYVLGNSSEGWYTNPQVRKPKRISFPRMFTKAGYFITPYFIQGQYNITIIGHSDNIHTLWYNLIENTGGVCYPYLLQTFKKYVKGVVSLMNGFDLNLFDKIEVNSETYTIFKLSNLDLNNRQVEIFAIQD